jgi:G3E family GTPase
MNQTPFSNTPLGHIHVYLLSGFLGAGKTTLLQRFLNHYSYRKIAVLKNECGEVNVDAQFISKLGFKVVEISNGSIFCTCRHDMFIDAMKEIATYPIDMLFIESSGIADPANFGKDLMLLLDLIGPIYHHLGNICLVDATSFLELVDLMPSIENQVRYSNIVLLNKIDLVKDSEISEIEEKIREINDSVRIVRTLYAELPLETLESVIGPLCLPTPKEGSNTQENKPFTMVLKSGSDQNILDPQAIYLFFNEFLGNTLRIKGFFHGPEGWMYIDGVNNILQVNKLEIPPSVSEIVVIFRPKTDLTLLDMIQTQWTSKFGEKNK